MFANPCVPQPITAKFTRESADGRRGTTQAGRVPRKKLRQPTFVSGIASTDDLRKVRRETFMSGIPVFVSTHLNTAEMPRQLSTGR